MLKLISNTNKSKIRYNSYSLNWKKLMSNINYSEDVAQGTYFATHTKNWHDYFEKLHCEIKLSSTLGPGNPLPRQGAPYSRDSNLCEVVD